MNQVIKFTILEDRSKKVEFKTKKCVVYKLLKANKLCNSNGYEYYNVECMLSEDDEISDQSFIVASSSANSRKYSSAKQVSWNNKYWLIMSDCTTEILNMLAKPCK